jgi:K319L-like, PKD domain
MPQASNFDVKPLPPSGAYPKPRINGVSTRAIQVQTSGGDRPATEVAITGANFLIRAVDPEVTINDQPLVHFRISDDENQITGYFFGTVTEPFRVVVDYGAGVRSEFAPPSVRIQAVTETLDRQIRLTGIASDAIGSTLTFEWRAVTKSAAIIHGDTATPDVQFGEGFGEYTFEVKVTNAAGASATASATIKFLGR